MIKAFNKNITSLLLMAISLILLIGFNVFWIYKNYQEQKTNLSKDLSTQFNQTMMAMQDSLIQSQLKTNIDTSNNNKNVTKTISFVRKSDKFSPTEIKKALTFLNDSLPKHRFDSSKVSGMSIFISSSNNLSPDSLKKLVGKITTGITRKEGLASITVRVKNDSTKLFFEKDSFQRKQRLGMNLVVKSQIKDVHKALIDKGLGEEKEPRNFVFVLKNDSLKVSEITKKYFTIIKKNKISMAFRLVKSTNLKDTLIVKGLKTESYKAGFPAINYFAVFDNYKPYLFRKILPEFLFSLFLISLTSFSFALIYQNFQKQKRLTELKNDFISNVTHELKTPISTVSVAIEALSNFNVLQNPTQTKEYLDISKNELNRLTMLVDKVLKMSIFEQKELDLKLEIIDFKTMLEGVLATMKLQFEKYQAAVNYDFIGDDFHIKGDTIHLTNVIYNLLDNALKYSPEPQIEIKLSANENEVVLSVKDNGVGIETAYQQKVFEKFFRVPTGDIHNIKGYGLGLSYVAKVIEKHEGEILLNSKIDEGSEFIIRLLRAA